MKVLNKFSMLRRNGVMNQAEQIEIEKERRDFIGTKSTVS